MFAKATINLVSDIDPDGTLIPVLCLNNSDKLSPLALVIKRNRFWFWQKPLYMPTGFTLNDVLVRGQAIEPEVEETDFVKYKGTFEDKLDATLNASGMGMANIKLEGKGFAKMQLSFGSLRKQELSARKLARDSTDKHLDLQHVLLEQVRGRRRHVLGVVRERVYTTEECSVCEETEEAGTCSSMFKPHRIKVSVKQSGSLEADSKVLLTIPTNTTLAYSLIELKVKDAGQYELCLLQGINGGFQVDSDAEEDGRMCTVTQNTTVSDRQDVEDVVDVRTHTASLLTDLEGVRGHLTLLASESVGTRTALLQQLSEFMKSQEALDSLEQALEDLRGGVTPDLSLLDQDPHLKTQVLSFLQLLPQAAGGATDPPQRPLLTPLHLLVSALDEMTDEGLSALSLCCSPPVLQALQQLVLRLASEGVCSPVSPDLAQEEVFQCVECLFAASGINLHREAGTLKSEGGALKGHLPLVMSIAVSGLAALGGSK